MCICIFANSSHLNDQMYPTFFCLAVLSLTEFFCFIFIAVPISSFNPCAFPEELKSRQTTIKLIEAPRYQLRCSHPRQQNPPLTLQDPYSLLPVKIQFATSSRWPSFWLSLSEWLWLKHSQAWLPCWWSPPAVGQTPTRQIGSTVRVLSSLERVFLCICFQLWYQVVSRVLIDFLCCLLSVGNHLGSMVHQRWGEHADIFILVLLDAFTLAHLFLIVIHCENDLLE